MSDAYDAYHIPFIILCTDVIYYNVFHMIEDQMLLYVCYMRSVYVKWF